MNNWVFPDFSNISAFCPINQGNNQNGNNQNGNNQNVNETEYQKIAREFCQYYHQLCDNNFPALFQLYNNNPKITYFNQEYTSFDKLLEYIRRGGIFKFHHSDVSHRSQPLSKNNILIHISGKISINNNLNYNRFSETIIIKKDGWNKYYITNSIFNIF